MSQLCLLSERPWSAIHLLFYAHKSRLQFDDVIIAIEDDSKAQTLKDYRDWPLSSFTLHFVEEPNHQSCVDTLNELAPEVLAINTPTTILDPQVINAPSIGAVNSHGAVLPEYRGYGSSHWAILYGSELGCSAHIVDQGVDTGPILTTEYLGISRFDRLDSVDKALYYQCKFQAMVEGIVGLLEGTIEPVPQPPDDGKQYFEMHDRIREIAQQVLQLR